MSLADQLLPGDRIALVSCNDQYTRLKPGEEGEVLRVRTQLGDEVVDVRWDSGSSLSLIPAAGDEWERV